VTKIIAIVGLPGSGKTYLGNRLAKENGYEFIDDIDIEGKKRLLAILKEGNDCIISDPNFIFEDIRNKAILSLAENLNIEWMFFENDPEQCLKNVEYRNDGRKVKDFISMFSKYYIIPKGVHPVKVYGSYTKMIRAPPT
jgi:hypothetical protein